MGNRRNFDYSASLTDNVSPGFQKMREAADLARQALGNVAPTATAMSSALSEVAKNLNPNIDLVSQLTQRLQEMQQKGGIPKELLPALESMKAQGLSASTAIQALTASFEKVVPQEEKAAQQAAAVAKEYAAMEAAAAKSTAALNQASTAHGAAAQSGSGLSSVLQSMGVGFVYTHANLGPLTVGLGGLVSQLAEINPLLAGGAIAVVALGSALAQAAEQGMKFQTLMVNLQNNTGATDEVMKGIAEDIHQVFTTIGGGLDDLAQGTQHILNFGNNAAQSLTILKEAAMKAVSTGADVNDTANLLASTMHHYGAAAEEAAQYTNIFVVAAQQGNTTFKDFTEHSARATSIAAGLQVPFNDTAAALSALTRAYGSSSQAQTQFINILTHMVNPTKAQSAEIKNLTQRTGVDLVHAFTTVGLSQNGLTGNINLLRQAYEKMGYSQSQAYGETMKLMNAQRGGLGMAVLLTNGYQDYRNVLSSAADVMSGKVNPTQDAFNRTQQTTQYQMELLGNKVQDLGIKFGSDMQPQLVKLIDGLGKFLDACVKVGEFIMTVLQPVLDLLGATFGALGKLFDDVGKAFDMHAEKVSNATTRWIDYGAAVGDGMQEGTAGVESGLAAQDALLQSAVDSAGTTGENTGTAYGGGTSAGMDNSQGDVSTSVSDIGGLMDTTDDMTTLGTGIGEAYATGGITTGMANKQPEIDAAAAKLVATADKTSDSARLGDGMGKALAEHFANTANAGIKQVEDQANAKIGLLGGKAVDLGTLGISWNESAWLNNPNSTSAAGKPGDYYYGNTGFMGGVGPAIPPWERVTLDDHNYDPIEDARVNNRAGTRDVGSTKADTANNLQKLKEDFTKKYGWDPDTGLPPKEKKGAKPKKGPASATTPQERDEEKLQEIADAKQLAAAEDAVTDAENRKKAALAPIDAILKSTQRTLKDMQAEHEKVTHGMGEQIYQYNQQLLKTQDEAKVALAPLEDAAKKADEKVKQLQKDMAEMDNQFAHQKFPLEDQLYGLEQAEKAALGPMKKHLQEIQDQLYALSQAEQAALQPMDDAIYDARLALDAQRESVQDLSDSYDKRLIPLQKQLDALNREDATAQRNKELYDLGLTVTNITERLQNAKKGTKEYNDLLHMQADAQGKLGNKQKEYSLQDAIQTIEAMKKAAVDSANEQVKASEKNLAQMEKAREATARTFELQKRALEAQAQSTQRQMELTQRQYDEQKELVQDQLATITRAQELYDRQQKDKIDAAGKEKEAADKALADAQANWAAKEKVIQDEIDAVNRRLTVYQHDAGEQERNESLLATSLQTMSGDISDAYDNQIDGLKNYAQWLKDSQKDRKDHYTETQAIAQYAKDFGISFAAASKVLDGMTKPIADAATSTKAFAGAITTDLGPAISGMSTTAGNLLKGTFDEWMKLFAVNGADPKNIHNKLFKHSDEGFFTSMDNKTVIAMDFSRGVWNGKLVALAAVVIDQNLVPMAGSAGTAATGVGKAIIDGFTVGVQDLLANAALQAAVAKAVTDAIAAGKAAANVNSPSLLARDTVGIPIIEGVAVGITAGAPGAANAMRGAIGGLFAGASSYLPSYVANLGSVRAPGGVGGSSQDTWHVTIGIPEGTVGLPKPGDWQGWKPYIRDVARASRFEIGRALVTK